MVLLTLSTALAQDVLLTKEFIDDPVAPGGIVTLRFTITNQHPTDTLSDFGFFDDLNAVLPGLTALTPLISAPCGAPSLLFGETFLTMSSASVGPTESCQVDVPLQVPAGASPGAYENITSGAFGILGVTPVAPGPAADSLIVGESDPIADMVAWANLAYGSEVIHESSSKARRRPSVWSTEIDTLITTLHAGGCLIEPVIQDHLGGAFATGELAGTWSGPGAVSGVYALPSITGELEGDGPVGATFSHAASTRYAADRGPEQFVAGRWVRIAGKRGVFNGVVGTCDGPTALAIAIDPWLPGPIGSWP